MLWSNISLGILGSVWLSFGAAAMDSPVVRSWLDNPVILNRASAGTLCIIPREFLSRTDVVLNGEILAPIIKYHGLRPSTHAIRSEVAHFFHLGRPAGKQPVQRNSIKCCCNSCMDLLTRSHSSCEIHLRSCRALPVVDYTSSCLHLFEECQTRTLPS